MANLEGPPLANTKAMRRLLLIGVTLSGLSACVPAPQGSVSTLPFQLNHSRVLSVTPGTRWYAQGLYDQARYRARALLLPNGDLVERSISPVTGSETSVFGVDPSDELESLNPFRSCNSSPRGEQAGRFSVRVAEAPPGWSPGLFSAAFLLHCGEKTERPLLGPRTNDPNQPIALVTLEFTLALRLLYVVDIPSSAQPGSYRVRLEVTYYPSGRTVTENLLFQVQPSR